MVFKGLLLLIIIFISVIMSILGLIFFLSYWKNKSKRNTWIAIFIFFVLSASFTSNYLAVKVENKAKQTANSIKEGFNGMLENAVITETDDRLYSDSTNSIQQINYLKSLVEEEIKDSIPSNFYHYFGFRDLYRYPLVYPYSISSIDVRNYAQLNDERNVVNISESNDGEIHLGINNITALSFDKNLLLTMTEDIYYPESEPNYYLFHFDSQEIEEFKDINTLLNRAKKLGFSGSEVLMSVEDYTYLF